jgi:hypothetical protein
MSQDTIELETPAAKKARAKRKHREHYGVNPISEFFFFLSKTDLHALRFCTPFTRSIQMSIGILVFITGVMAFISSYFAINSVFFGGAQLDIGQLVIAFVVSLFYATAIIFFDREIVSATGKNIVLTIGRLLFAVFIGIVISFPIELKIQQDEVDQQIVKLAHNKFENEMKFNENYTKTIDIEKKIMSQQSDKDLKTLQNKLDALTNAYNDQLAGLNGQEPTRGSKAIALEPLIESAKKDLEKAEIRHAEMMQNIDNTLTKKHALEYQKYQDNLEKISKAEKAHDLLTQFLALKKVHAEKPDTKMLGWIIMAFFIMFELFPTLIKLALEGTEYNAYIDARRVINVNKIIGLANYSNAALLNELNRDENRTFEGIERLRKLFSQTEITDIFEDIMEDPHHEVYRIAKSSDQPQEGQTNANG